MSDPAETEPRSRSKDNIVRATRKVLGWTRVDFAARTGLSLELINDVERRRPVGKQTAEAVAGELSEGVRSKYSLSMAHTLGVSSFFDQSGEDDRFIAKSEWSRRDKRVEAVAKFLGSPAPRK